MAEAIVLLVCVYISSGVCAAFFTDSIRCFPRTN